MKLQIVDDGPQFTALAGEWTELLADSRADCLFLTWEWLYTWWRHLGHDRRPFIVTLRDDDSKLVAIAPLMTRRVWSGRVVECAGSGSVGSDYLDFIIRRSWERKAADTLSAFLVESRLPLKLPSLRDDSAAAAAIAPMLENRGWQSRRVPMQVCPYIDLSKRSWDAYLQEVGPRHRYNFRRRLRNLERTHTLALERADTEETSRDALRLLIALHLDRWSRRGGSDAFHTPALRAFHEDFIATALRQGWLRLRVLKVDGIPAAAFYGFRHGDKLYFYQSGFDERWAGESIGLVLMGMMIREAVEEGVSEYDFLHGDESYKFLWTDRVRPLSRLELYPPGPVGSLHRTTVEAVTATRRLVKRALAVGSR